jgi:small conductance mechanosensitive channel
VLQLFGIQTASLVAVLGATTLAIRPGTAGYNLAAGVMSLIFRPFRIDLFAATLRL